MLHGGRDEELFHERRLLFPLRSQNLQIFTCFLFFLVKIHVFQFWCHFGIKRFQIGPKLQFRPNSENVFFASIVKQLFVTLLRPSLDTLLHCSVLVALLEQHGGHHRE
jgi:hypothetical protein